MTMLCKYFIKQRYYVSNTPRAAIPQWEANSQLCLSVKWTSFDLKNQHNATGRHNHNRKRVLTLFIEVKQISVLCV